MTNNRIGFLIFLACGILLLWLGYLVKYKQRYWLISGYNTMTQAQKQKVDVQRLGALVGNLLFGMAFLFLLSGSCFVLGWEQAGMALILLVLPITIFAVIKAQRYDGNALNPDGTYKKRTILLIGSITLFLVFVSIGMVMLFVQGEKKPVLELNQREFHISGLYGVRLPLTDITDVERSSDFPVMKRRVSGYAVGTIRKGRFLLASQETALVYLDYQDTCVLQISTTGKSYFVSMSDVDCELWYTTLKEKISANS